MVRSINRSTTAFRSLLLLSKLGCSSPYPPYNGMDVLNSLCEPDQPSSTKPVTQELNREGTFLLAEVDHHAGCSGRPATYSPESQPPVETESQILSQELSLATIA